LLLDMRTGRSLELRVGTLAVGDGRVIEDARIGIANGLFAEISSENLTGKYKEFMDLRDRYAMPGLIDAHVHIRYGPERDVVEPSDEYQAIRGAENARKALMAGVTTLADAGAPRNISFAVRNAINAGVTIGPRLYACGDIIGMTGGFSRQPGARLEVTGPDEARRTARELLMYHGADFLKVRATGAISSPHTGPRHPQLTVEEMRPVVEEAHKCGKKVHAHCYGEAGISNALEAGVDAIVHGQSLTGEHIAEMKERGVILLPTLKTYCDHFEHEGGVNERIVTTGIWDETEPNFRRALEEEVPIAMGTDAGMPSNLFGENPRDLEYMVAWGMTPSQAITAGTLNAATSIRMGHSLGTVEPGKHADLLILGGDPTEDISRIRLTLEEVYINGVRVRPPD